MKALFLVAWWGSPGVAPKFRELFSFFAYPPRGTPPPLRSQPAMQVLSGFSPGSWFVRMWKGLCGQLQMLQLDQGVTGSTVGKGE